MKATLSHTYTTLPIVSVIYNVEVYNPVSSLQITEKNHSVLSFRLVSYLKADQSAGRSPLIV